MFLGYIHTNRLRLRLRLQYFPLGVKYTTKMPSINYDVTIADAGTECGDALLDLTQAVTTCNTARLALWRCRGLG